MSKVSRHPAVTRTTQDSTEFPEKLAAGIARRQEGMFLPDCFSAWARCLIHKSARCT